MSPIRYARGGSIVEDCAAEELAERFGTPLYVVSEDQLRRNARSFRGDFESRWPGQFLLLPSIKANSAFALRHILNRRGPAVTCSGRASWRSRWEPVRTRPDLAERANEGRGGTRARDRRRGQDHAGQRRELERAAARGRTVRLARADSLPDAAGPRLDRHPVRDGDRWIERARGSPALQGRNSDPGPAGDRGGGDRASLYRRHRADAPRRAPARGPGRVGLRRGRDGRDARAPCAKPGTAGCRENSTWAGATPRPRDPFGRTLPQRRGHTGPAPPKRSMPKRSRPPRQRLQEDDSTRARSSSRSSPDARYTPTRAFTWRPSAT